MGLRVTFELGEDDLEHFRLIMQQATSGAIHDMAVQEGMRTMYQDGLNKCLLGTTTLDEILRVTQEA